MDTSKKNTVNMGDQMDNGATEGTPNGDGGTVLVIPAAIESASEPSDTLPESSSPAVTEDKRMGTTASARFNILSTMVGGGSLSLPMAFQKSGNALMGPLLLLLVALVSDFCFHILVNSARKLSPISPNQTTPGKDSFESIASAAFGNKANVFSMGLVTAMCFFGCVGYAVLLRDMLLPITEVIFHTSEHGPTVYNNMTMLTVVFLVTPLCTLKTLTALKRFGAASMFSVLILGSCIVFRSLECNLGSSQSGHWWDAYQLWPDSWKELLDAFPLFISCYVCHYNLLPVHNEFRNPSPQRISWWLRSTAGAATGFYMVMGVAGSAYGRCTATGTVHGNVLLDFPDDDPLLLVGRMCLAITITLAFPMLTIPARDIIIRSLPKSLYQAVATEHESSGAPDDAEERMDVEQDAIQSLQEPLLEANTADGIGSETVSASFGLRLLSVTVFFWSAAAVASCVSSIDVVWGLLGSSLSILLSHLIPCASYLVISKRSSQSTEDPPSRHSIVVAWILILVSTPLMFLSTGNAMYSNFFREE